MNIYLSNTTNFSNNGLGFLTDIISANVIDELNGNYQLQLVYIRDGKLSEYLVEENIIKCKVSDSTYQLFRITNVEKTFKTITIIAKHIFYDLLNNFLENTYPQNLSCQLFLQHILDHTNFSNNFTAVSDISTTKTARYVRMNPVSAIIGDNNNSMVNLFGGELKRDNFTINFLSRVGSNNGVKLLIGKNITGINISIDITSMATRIMPQGFDGLLLPELYVDSPLINNYPTPKIVKIEFSDVVYDPDVENAYHDIQDAYAELRRRAEEQYSLGIDKPKINIKIDWIELSKTEEYKSYQNLERVNLGDTITAYILGINYETRVISTNYDVLKDMIVDFEIGTVKPSITSSMSKIQKSVEEINPDSILKTAKDEATELITTAMGGYVYKTESELYIMNTNDPTTATKVWRWNINGLGYSSTGINGPYGIAMTMDGAIVADYITTGTLNTSVIQGYDSIVTTVSGISTTYETKTDATSKLNTAKTYAEGQASTAETNAISTANANTDTKINNIKIGGENLLRDTQNFGREGVSENTMGYLMNFNSTIDTNTYQNFKVRTLTSSNASAYICQYYIDNCKNSEQYTVSFYAKGEGSLRAYFHGPTGYIGCKIEGNVVQSDGQVNIQLTSEWKRYSITWTLKDTGGTTDVKYLLFRNDNLPTTWSMCGLKLEKGNKATEWSPSPFDYSTTVEMNSAIVQKANEITSTVSETYITKTDSATNINTAKSEAISSANNSTDTKLQNYTNTTGMNSAINTAKQNAIDTSDAHTDTKLTNYSTTTQMNSAIDQKADTITSSVSATYITKTDSATNIATAKSEAISSANSSTDTKLQNYTNTTDMNTAIGTAENNAKTYADGKASTAENNAKTYADGVSSTAETNAKNYTNSELDNITNTIDETTTNKSFYIENAQNEKPIEFELYGDTSQDETPTPDNPVNIETVTGRQGIVVSGKNLLDISDITNKTGITRVDDVITLNGTSTSTSWALTNPFVLKANITYTLSLTNTYANASNSTFILRNGNTNIFGVKYNDSDKQTRYTPTQDVIVDTLRIYRDSAVTFDNYSFSVQLEVGSSSTEYEKYNGKPYEINLGKNLYDPSFRSDGGTIYSKNCTVTESNGVFTLTATGTDAYMWSVRNTGDTYDTTQGQLYEFDAENYTATISNPLFTKNFVTFYDENLVSLGFITKTSTTFRFSKNDKANAKYFTLRFGYGSATIGESYLYTIQLEKGTKASSYSPYKEPIELCEINDYQDKIFKRDNRWYLRKEIGKVVLDGSETAGVSFQTSTHRYTTRIDDIYNDNSETRYYDIILNRFLASATILNQVGYAFHYKNAVFMYLDTSITTLEEAKTYIQSNNVTLYYPLATPITEEISDNELLEQLDAFELITGINNITNTSFDLAGNMYLKYYLHTPISDTYVNKVELNSQLKITSESISSEVNATYETKTDATSKLGEAKGYTDNQLTSYSTTTQMNSAITQKADEITQSVSQTYTTLDVTGGLSERVEAAEGNLTTQGAKLNIISKNIDSTTGDIKSVKTLKGFTLDDEGFKIATSESDFNSLSNETGTYYKDGDTILTQFTKDNSITKDLVLYGTYYYGVDKDLDVSNFTKDNAMFVAEKYTDNNNEVGFGHFYNGGD